MRDIRTLFLARRLAKPFAGVLLLVAMASGAQVGVPWTPAAAPGGVQTPPGGALGAQVFAGAGGGVPAGGQPNTWTASLFARETATNNVNLTSSSTAEFAMVTELTPTLIARHSGSLTNFYGFASIPVTIYAPSHVTADRAFPTVNLIGDVALVKNLVFVEGAINVTQQFFDPFGAQPITVTNPTANRYRSDLYRISPVIRSTTPGNVNYELRWDNIWTNLSGAPISANNSYYSAWSGIASDVRGTLGWQASFNYTDIRFSNQTPINTQIYRATPLYNVSPQLRLSASGGYERNEFTLTSSSGAIYGVGFIWNPTPRTNVSGDWEHRFFGSSYRFNFDHATPLSAWQVGLSRNITSYPQQIATVPGGVSVASFLNNLFVLRIPDPAQRQQLIDAFIQERGLPAAFSSPVNLYTEQILLQQAITARIGLIGARNSLFVTFYDVKNQPISAAGEVLPPLLSTGNDNTQTGLSVIWTHQLTPSLAFLAAFDGLRTLGNAPSIDDTRQGTVRLVLTRPLSPRTAAFVGARYQSLQSNVATDYDETAVFVGLNHRFH